MDKIKLPIESDEGLSGEQVVKNSLNNSTSKQQFSFPKALRFIHNKTLQDTREYYDPPSTRSTKAATIGQSQRKTLCNPEAIGPAPCEYTFHKEGQFGYLSQKVMKFAGGIIGLGRSEVKHCQFLPTKSVSPGPAQYYPNEEVIHPRITEKCTFFKSKKLEKHHDPDLDNIGPGWYMPKELLSDQNRVLSQYHTSAAPRIIEPKIQVRKQHSQQTPKLYNPKMNSRGDNLSYCNKSKGIRIGNSRRSNLVIKLQVPGPGKQQDMNDSAKCFQSSFPKEQFKRNSEI